MITDDDIWAMIETGTDNIDDACDAYEHAEMMRKQQMEEED